MFDIAVFEQEITDGVADKVRSTNRVTVACRANLVLGPGETKPVIPVDDAVDKEQALADAIAAFFEDNASPSETKRVFASKAVQDIADCVAGKA